MNARLLAAAIVVLLVAVLALSIVAAGSAHAASGDWRADAKPEDKAVLKAAGVGTIRIRSAKFAHRIIIPPGKKYWTLFVFGPDFREWGFHCKNGWVPHYEFGKRGCD